MKENYRTLSGQQKEQISVKENEIVFSHPYLIGMLMDEQASKNKFLCFYQNYAVLLILESRAVEITMIFHVLKNPESYQNEMLESSGNSLTTWASNMKKMRDNVIVCNYKFFRDMSKNTPDESWIITGLNHWSPNEYLQQQ